MRKFFLFIFAITITGALHAQTKVTKKTIEKATDETTALYNLSPEQQAKVYKMQERRLNNLKELEPMKTTDPDTYYRKRAAVRIAFEGHLQRILTDDQKKIYQTQVAERHQREAEKKKELKRQGASKEQIEKSLLEIE